MKLATLLGLGTSFFGGGQLAEYRLNRRGWLPKFNEGRNPFAPAAAPETPETAADAPVVSPAPQMTTPGVFKPVAKVAEPQRAVPEARVPAPSVFRPIAKASKPQRAGSETGAPVKAAKPGWTTRLNPFRAPEPKAQPPCAVQPELSLAAIKVVHNDLADADVEIVPVKARAGAPTPAMLSPARQAWEYAGENLLKSS